MNETLVGSKEPELSVIEHEIDRVFALQQANRYAVANTVAAQRIEKLRTLLELVNGCKKKIREAVYEDFRKPGPEVDLTETFVVTSEIKHSIKHLKKWMKAKKVKRTLAMATTSSWIQYEPKGNVLIISPWNFPFNLTMGPLVSAVAAGNCIIVKPSELTPHTSQLMKEMVERIFPENEIAFFLGDKEIATKLLKRPFDHIFFTGSPAVGKIVMKAAANHLATVTLELGGKSPVIVDESANIADTAQKIAWGKYMNNGQTCVAPDYLYVHENIRPEFVNALKNSIQAFYGPEGQRQSSPDYARIISDGHHTRLRQLLDDTVNMGARVAAGGPTIHEERYFPPTVLTDVSSESPIMQEEIFGPLLPVLTFNSPAELLQVIQSKPKPLALYIFSRNKRNIQYILSHTRAGSTCINDVVVHFMHWNLPFGGINNSGFGNSHGFYGFKAFSHERAVLKQGRFSPLKLMYPPYRKRTRKFIEWTLKYL